ncbi:uncharacterized protein LOC118407530 [Branchiostoma floridae]|uniref:Uncharacterized protein LOC118407530 n=1 Tax=Branchiostoma floridae TaxID=7739 RepID=A0A9J7HT47_BRAFL|nr:uncharacterized protein LOC118407530 [Branchiostoma floridae]
MEGPPALPTEEEVEGMTFGMIVEKLKALGIHTADLEEKKDAKERLLKTIKEVHDNIATRRQPGKITKTLQQAISENKKKREGLTQICNSILEFVDSMEDDDKQKMEELFGQDLELQVILENVRTFLQNDDCPILVVGE